MNDSYPTPWSGETADGLISYEADSPPQTDERVALALRGKFLPSMTVGLYYLISWLPSSWPLPELRWYLAFPLGVFAFLTQGAPLSMRAASPFWVVYGLSFAGALASLLAATNFDQALWNTVGFGVSLATFLLFLPVLATRLARRVILFMLILSSFLWSFEIQRLVSRYGSLALSSLAEVGGNKNAVGITLILAGTALFYLAVFWRPARLKAKLPLRIMRLVFGAAGLYLFYNLVLIYDRSGLLEAASGIGTVLGVIWIKSPRKSSAFVRIGIIVFMLILIGILVLPSVLKIAPVWELIYDRTFMEGVESFGNREILLRKGLYLVSQNPILGVGIGGTKDAVYSLYAHFPNYYIHNMYLTDWAEKGILGLLSYLVLFVIYLKLVRRVFFDLPISDQTWLVLFIPLSVALFFKDMNTLHIAIATIITGIYYEQHLLQHTQTEQPVFPYNGV